MTFLYKANATRGMEWARCFAARAPDLPFRLWPDIGDPAQVRYLAVWAPPENIAATFPNLELVFSVGAGSTKFDFSQLPPHVPLIRMCELATSPSSAWAPWETRRSIPCWAGAPTFGVRSANHGGSSRLLARLVPGLSAIQLRKRSVYRPQRPGLRRLARAGIDQRPDHSPRAISRSPARLSAGSNPPNPKP